MIASEDERIGPHLQKGAGVRPDALDSKLTVFRFQFAAFRNRRLSNPLANFVGMGDGRKPCRHQVAGERSGDLGESG
jgi:hypothetical protein